MNQDKLKYLRQLKDLYGDEIFLLLEDKKEIIQSSFKNKVNKNTLLSNRNNFNNCLKCADCYSEESSSLSAGDPNASLLIIGERPGEQKKLISDIFVEEVGILLDKMLLAIDMSRENDVFICNVLNCVFKEGLNSKKQKINDCEPYLNRQIDLIQPKLIVALGENAGKSLLCVEKSLKEMRGTVYKFRSKKLVVTHHPLALLKNASLKSEAWEDFKWIRNLLKLDK